MENWRNCCEKPKYLSELLSKIPSSISLRGKYNSLSGCLKIAFLLPSAPPKHIIFYQEDQCSPVLLVMYLKTPEVLCFVELRSFSLLSSGLHFFKNIAQYRPEYPSYGLPTGKPSMENYCFHNLAHLSHEGLCAETLLFEIVTLPFVPQAVFETMSDVNFTDVLTPLILDLYSKCQNWFSSQIHLVTHGRSFQNDTTQSK